MILIIPIYFIITNLLLIYQKVFSKQIINSKLVYKIRLPRVLSDRYSPKHLIDVFSI